MEEIEIPNEVTSIGQYAFCRCTSLESIQIPANVTRIERNAFVSCRNLNNATFDGHAYWTIYANNLGAFGRIENMSADSEKNAILLKSGPEGCDYFYLERHL